MHRFVLALALLLTGCTSTKKVAGGFASAVLGRPSLPATPTADQPVVVGGATSTTLTAPEDPAASSTQTVERIDERGDVINLPVERVTVTTKPDGSVVEITETLVPTPVTRSRTSQKSTTALGASHVDTSKTTAVQLSSLQPVRYIGIVLVVAALAMFHPVVFAIVRSRTMQAAVGVGGIALIILPNLVVGNEQTLMRYGFIVIVGLLLWFFIHRHAQLQGFVDANNDGIDDRNQPKK